MRFIFINKHWWQSSFIGTNNGNDNNKFVKFILIGSKQFVVFELFFGNDLVFGITYINNETPFIHIVYIRKPNVIFLNFFFEFL